MNRHLKPVFEIILPEIERKGFDNWVFGGVSIAGLAGKFIRENKDVDVFVKLNDFDIVKKILSSICVRYGYKPQLKDGDRPKFEIYVNSAEMFSMIPVFIQNDRFLFKNPEGDQQYSVALLEKVERKIGGFNFITPNNYFIKEMFINHIKARPDKRTRTKIIIDAKMILNNKEYIDLGFK